MGFNLSQNNLVAAAEEGYEFEIVHPDTQEPLGGFIKVRGARSKTLQAFSKKKINEQLRADQALKAKGKSTVQTYEDLEDAVIERAAISVISWRGIEDTINGEVVSIPFSKEAAIKLFTEQPWIRDQVLEASNDSEKFRSE